MTEMTLQEYFKILHISTVYIVYEKSYTENPVINAFLKETLMAEFQSRKANRQMRILKQAGFSTLKKFEDLNLKD